MTKKFLLLLIILVFITSLITLLLIIKYVNPYSMDNIILWFLAMSFILSVSSFFTFIFYIIKKIHYRWEVLINHISSSFRQGFLISIYLLALLLFYRLEIPLVLSSIILFLLLLIFEIFFQNIFN